jgi:hypothetical protein
MTIGTAHLALCNFRPDFVHRADVANHRADCGPFPIADVIEFEDSRIRLAAIDARMLPKIVE